MRRESRGDTGGGWGAGGRLPIIASPPRCSAALILGATPWSAACRALFGGGGQRDPAPGGVPGGVPGIVLIVDPLIGDPRSEPRCELRGVARSGLRLLGMYQKHTFVQLVGYASLNAPSDSVIRLERCAAIA